MTVVEPLKGFAAEINNMKAGESASRCHRIAIKDVGPVVVQEALADLRTKTNQMVSRLRKTGGNEFRVESCAGLTNDYSAILCTVNVMCVSETEDDEIDI